MHSAQLHHECLCTPPPWYYQCTPTPWVPPGQTAGYEILAKSSTFLVLTMRRFHPISFSKSTPVSLSKTSTEHGLLLLEVTGLLSAAQPNSTRSAGPSFAHPVPPHDGVPISNMLWSYPRLQHGLLSFLVNVHNGSVHRLSAVVQTASTKRPLKQIKVDSFNSTNYKS